MADDQRPEIRSFADLLFLMATDGLVRAQVVAALHALAIARDAKADDYVLVGPGGPE